MALAAVVAILMTMALAMVRAVLGPSVYDRILAANNFGTNTVLLVAVGGHVLRWNSFVDVALLYAMVNFVTTIAIMRYFESSHWSRSERAAEEA